MTAFTIHKLADRSGRRVMVEGRMVNPDTPGTDHEPWPLAGVGCVGEPPATLEISQKKVMEGKREGWITCEGEEVVHRPGGPADNPWQVTHTFLQLTALVFHFVSGDVRYKVMHNPDKYVEGKSAKAKVTDEIYAAGQTRVDFFYRLKKEG